ncbi:hypothetical protein COB72_04440 [bacterium]|nr:MAG: hypothetical protein COB72_04440 [bacterium]
MDERSSRIFFGLCMLVLVWIGVYWMWQPSHQSEPSITFATNPVAQNKPIVESDIPQISPAEAEPDPIPELIKDPIVAPPKQVPVLIPPEFTEHIVQPNELMQTIAKQYFGSIDDWAIIAKANPRVDPRKLKPGMVLRIPKDKTNIQGKLAGKQALPGVITPHTDDGSKIIEYVVSSGDSLSLISQRIYGSSRHAKFIFDSNRDVLRSMDSIAIGQLLKLPPLPEDQESP